MSITINKSAKQASNASTDVKTVVIEIMNDQLFLRNMIQQLSLENLIQKELNNKLPDHTKSIKEKVKTHVHDIVNNKLKDFQRDTIPSLVAKELTNQITAFLNNHTQMNQLIEYHTNQLNAALTDTARKTLSDLVNEPQYHLTTTAHLTSMSTKCDLKILEIQSVLNQQLSNNYQSFDEQLKALKNTNNRELSELKDHLQETKQLNKDFSTYKVNTSCNNQSIQNLQTQVTTLQWLLGITMIAIGGLCYYKK